MPNISADFSVEGSAVVQAHSVAYGATVDLAVLSQTGIDTYAWSIIGTSKSDQAAPSITPAGTPSGSTASFVMPSDPGDGLGRAFLVKLTVTGRGQTDTQYRVVGAVNAANEVPACVGEENHRNATHGYTDVFNRALATVGLDIGDGEDVGDAPQWNGTIWVRRKFWITPDIDPTGVVDCQAAIQAAINAAEPGCCIYIPSGAYRMDGGLEVKPGVTISGDERGMRGGFRVYDVGYTHVGATFYMHDTSDVLFTMRQQSSVFNVEVYYPNQWAGEAGPTSPTAYNWTFEIPTNDHGCSVGNISCVNPYQFMFIHCDGFKLDDVWAFPLQYGLRLGRCADITRMTNIHFQGATNFDNQAALFSYVRDNAIAYDVDGAEGAEFLNCFAIGYLRGLRFHDIDSDGFRGVSGSWRGGGFDSCRICCRLDDSQMLTARGFRFAEMGFIPYGGDGTGVGLMLADDLTPSQADHYPMVTLSGCSFSGFEHDTGIWATSTSNSIVVFKGGSMQQFANQAVLNQSATAKIYLDHIAIPNGETRSVNSGGGTLSDINQITIG